MRVRAKSGPRWRALRLAPFLALAFFTALGVCSPGLWAAEPDFPALTGRVIDNANLLSAADETQLVSVLAAHADKSTDQVVVVTLPSLQGFEIEEFGYRLGRHWGIGQQEKDNGVLLIIAPKERKMRIEVGRKLEPLLTDALSRLIIENDILPRFRDGEIAGGIKAGVQGILAVLARDAEELTASSQVREEKLDVREDKFDDLAMIFIVIIWLIIIASVVWNIARAVRQGHSPASGSGKTSSGWNWGSGGSGGGGWSSGGGGFSGGGGGFGGGGSSGSW